METNILTTRDLCKTYKEPAVNHASLEVKEGQIFGLVGKNGAGKTTLIRMLTGQTLPTSGEMSLFGATAARELMGMRSRLGCMVETPSFFPYLTAQENLEYYRIQRGIPGREAVDKALAQVGLDDTGKKKFRNFSLGMKQRLGLALAIMGQPELLLLDEPINGLDPMGIVEFRDILLKLNREKGTTILISSHILSELSNLATHYGFLEKGRLLEQVSAEEIRSRCRDCLEIRVQDPAKAAAALEQAGIRDLEVLPEGELRLYSHLDRSAEVARILVEGGAGLERMNPRSGSLEDYFLNLVGGTHHA